MTSQIYVHPFMKNLFRMLFKRQPVAPKFKTSDAPSTLQSGSEAANRQQLVLIALRDLLRRNAIPAHLLDCQTLLVTSRSRGPGLYVHLVVRHWDERLLRYMQAFQTELKERIVRFDPKAINWVHGIAWDFNATGNCPYPALPPKSTWDDDQKPSLPSAAANEPATDAAPHYPAVLAANAAAVPVATKASEVEQDLAALFAIRDREINAAAGGVTAGGAKATRDYEATEPAPLS